MSEGVGSTIPPSLIRDIADAPTDRPVVLLLRHSARGPLPDGEAGNDVPITLSGKYCAEELGRKLGARIRSLHSSPVPRCIQTANALREGANAEIDIVVSRLFGDPGVYVLDGDLAWSNWERLGHEEVMRRIVSEDDPLPGMAPPDEASRVLLRHMLTSADGISGLHLFITHDSVITATVSRLQGTPHGPLDWPCFLEGALFWQSEKGVHVVYREAISLIRLTDPESQQLIL
jgi:broad specificity phosphatase PhoE